jgi:hypothetical protein
VKLIGLMPFIQTSSNSTQRRLRFLSSIPATLATIGGALAFTPSHLRAALVRLGSSDPLDPFSMDATTKLIRADSIRVAFTLASHEFADLDSEEAWDDVEHFCGRCVCDSIWSSSLPAYKMRADEPVGRKYALDESDCGVRRTCPGDVGGHKA